MKAERTPEEAARAKRTNATVMMAVGAVTAACALAGGYILMTGRGDVPDWMFGGEAAVAAPAGDWANLRAAARYSAFETAFARAAKEKKLVLLVLGPTYNAATGRWASEIFGGQETEALIDARFVPVRVRSEESPDLDRRYRAGGWPTAAILRPDGSVVDAGVGAPAPAFRRWAVMVADKAAGGAAARKAEDPTNGATPPSAEAAAADAQAALLRSWDPARRTFERRGPRFPRFERIAALSRLKSSWARNLAAEAAKGAVLFQDRDGSFRRTAGPDGRPTARETVASVQADALDALCASEPEAARRLLSFLDEAFRASGGAGWLGWRSGYAFDAKKMTASDGANFDAFAAAGGGETGPARPADDARLAAAVLECAVATPAQKSFAKKVVARLAAAPASSRPLLDDAVALGAAALAAGDAKAAAAEFRRMEKEFSGGTAYLDRAADGIADPALNAAALRFVRRLKGPEAAKRAVALNFWLSARPGALDPAVRAALAAEESR